MWTVLFNHGLILAEGFVVAADQYDFAVSVIGGLCCFSLSVDWVVSVIAGLCCLSYRGIMPFQLVLDRVVSVTLGPCCFGHQWTVLFE